MIVTKNICKNGTIGEKDADVEYTRTDVFIERALAWIKENIRPYYHAVRYKYEDFENYMKGEEWHEEETV